MRYAWNTTTVVFVHPGIRVVLRRIRRNGNEGILAASRSTVRGGRRAGHRSRNGVGWRRDDRVAARETGSACAELGVDKSTSVRTRIDGRHADHVVGAERLDLRSA